MMRKICAVALALALLVTVVPLRSRRPHQIGLRSRPVRRLVFVRPPCALRFGSGSPALASWLSASAR